MQAQTGIDGTIVRREFAKGPSRHWLIPPNIYNALDEEFGFTFDPFPYPRPEGWDALKMDWGAVNFVNPPFIRDNGIGRTSYVRKAIEENQKGRTVVLTLPTYGYLNLLLEAGAEMRSLGRVRWLDVNTGTPMQGPGSIVCAILRGKGQL